MLGPIEKAIQKSDLGLNPNNDGQVIRLALPQLNEERRKELVKQVHKRAEEARVAVRNCRRDASIALRKAEKDGGISQDDEAPRPGPPAEADRRLHQAGRRGLQTQGDGGHGGLS